MSGLFDYNSDSGAGPVWLLGIFRVFTISIVTPVRLLGLTIACF